MYGIKKLNCALSTNTCEKNHFSRHLLIDTRFWMVKHMCFILFLLGRRRWYCIINFSIFNIKTHDYKHFVHNGSMTFRHNLNNAKIWIYAAVLHLWLEYVILCCLIHSLEPILRNFSGLDMCRIIWKWKLDFPRH